MINFIRPIDYPISKALKTEKNTDRIGMSNFNDGGENYLGYLERSLESRLTYRQMDAMYVSNPFVRACVDKRVERACSIEAVVKAMPISDKETPDDDTKRQMDEVYDLISNPNRPCIEDFDTIRKKVHRDLLTFDAGALEVSRSVSGSNKIVGLYSVPGDTIRKNVDKKGNFKSQKEAYFQVENGKTYAKFPYDRLLYMMLNPRAGSAYGLAPLETLASTVTAELYAAYHNLVFFANDATPKLAISFNNTGLSVDSAMTKVKRWMAWFDQEYRGRPHRPLILANDTGAVQVTPISMSGQDMQFSEYGNWLLTKIMAVFKMQPLIMGIVTPNTGQLNSEQQERQFKIDALGPDLRYFASVFSRYIIWDENFGLGYKNIYLDYYGVDLTDDNLQSQIDERYVRNGIFTINDIRAELGAPPVWWGDVPFINAAYQPVTPELLAGETQDESTEEKPKKDKEDKSPKEKGMQAWQLLLKQYGHLATGLPKDREKQAIQSLRKKRISNRSWLVMPGTIGYVR